MNKNCNNKCNRKGRVPLPNGIIFWKSFKGGGGGIFNPKIYIADLGNFKRGLKLIKRRVISGFRVCFFNKCIDIN